MSVFLLALARRHWQTLGVAAVMLALGFYAAAMRLERDAAWAHLAQYKAEAAAQRAQIQRRQSRISGKYAAKAHAATTRIRTIYKTIAKEAPKYVTIQMDAGCVLPHGFVSLWNDASAMSAVPDAAAFLNGAPSAVKLSDVSRRHAADAEQYYQIAAQLKMLQNWVRAQRAATQ
ncbi:MAG TPA: hypothetical protein DEP05_02840 [Betaproteobacteria bacterium]|nr:hypothetical protein [Betaproteobacteria bacterium]